MSWKVKNSVLYKVIIGNTRTKQVSGASKRIVVSKDLSKKVYSKIDNSDNFTVKGENGKVYKVRQLVPAK
ncbi:hypothetical protein OOZ15_13410 [Galbibacter sp. EGI 63066]|uniref:hypothetical protein n=1 Tax=Galbibacter sp. EGI 63066 TaxID=2993559 RepID=UPI002248A687|nr:hypothetical protein [Galbibacter sp. EGI 63066]MCX2680945.1 hypothetical protein [Galbibacter sp. EGI 63066]